MKKEYTFKELEDFNKLENYLKIFPMLQQNFLRDPNVKNASIFSKILNEYEKVGSPYFSEFENSWIDKMHEGIRDYFMDKINTKYLGIFWDESEL